MVNEHIAQALTNADLEAEGKNCPIGNDAEQNVDPEGLISVQTQHIDIKINRVSSADHKITEDNANKPQITFYPACEQPAGYPTILRLPSVQRVNSQQEISLLNAKNVENGITSTVRGWIINLQILSQGKFLSYACFAMTVCFTLKIRKNQNSH